jgi:alkylated DNA repair dioxygenase AlkB
VLAVQPGLFDQTSPSFDPAMPGLVRHQLDGEAWVDHHPGWLSGHARVFDALYDAVSWSAQRRQMYDSVLDVPRLFGALPTAGAQAQLIAEMSLVLSERYGVRFDRLSVALYRDGDDSVAWHGDQVAREIEQAHVATLSLGAPRRFLLRPLGPADGRARRAFHLGWGDLVVMGGACQRTWQHCVPKVPRADPRMVVMFRPSASFDAPPR